MGFNSAFKGLMHQVTVVRRHETKIKYKCVLRHSVPFYEVRKS